MNYKDELSQRDIWRAMLNGSESTSDELKKTVDALRLLVLALLMEVEALREATIAEAPANGQSLKHSAYGRSYVSTALLTHNNAGPTNGLDKLLRKWLPVQSQAEYFSDLRFREALMFKRLGFNADEIAAYKEDAERREQFT